MKPYENTTLALQGYYYIKADKMGIAGSNGNVDWGGPAWASPVTAGVTPADEPTSDGNSMAFSATTIARTFVRSFVYGVFLPEPPMRTPALHRAAEEVRAEAERQVLVLPQVSDYRRPPATAGGLLFVWAAPHPVCFHSRVMIEEIFDVVDDRDQIIGTATRSDVHARKLRHRAVHVFLFNLKGELFIQKRAATKDSFPRCYDSSASGH